MDTPSPLRPSLESCTSKISAPHVPLSFSLLLALDIAFQQQKSPRNAPSTSPSAARRATCTDHSPQPSPHRPSPCTLNLAAVQSMQDPLNSGKRLLLLPIASAETPLSSGRRGPPHPLLRIPRERTPQQQIKQEFLCQLLYHKDGSLRGGTLQKVLVHIAFVVVDPELTDCFLHGYRCVFLAHLLASPLMPHTGATVDQTSC